MPRYIVELKGRYMGWSTVTDRPFTALVHLSDLKEILKQEAIETFEREFRYRMERVEKTGNSAIGKQSTEDLLAINFAGQNEQSLTIDEIIEKYWWDYEDEKNNKMFDTIK